MSINVPPPQKKRKKRREKKFFFAKIRHLKTSFRHLKTIDDFPTPTHLVTVACRNTHCFTTCN